MKKLPPRTHPPLAAIRLGGAINVGVRTPADSCKNMEQDIQVTQNIGWPEVILDLNLMLPLGKRVNLDNFIKSLILSYSSYMKGR